MDLQKFLRKVPAFVKKFQDATNFDKKLTFADVQFALDLVALALSQSVTQDAESGGFRMASQSFNSPGGQTVLNPENHAQMMEYLASLPEVARGGQGDDSDPRQSFQWLPVLVFSVDLARKLLEAWKKKKNK